jgi:predicted ATPase/class 3 adenylate cyclase
VGVSAPSRTVTFLFTDIERSTRLWQADESAMRAALSRHDELLREAVAGSGGVVFSSMGDGLAAAFSSPSAAVAAALDAQRLLEGELWPTATPVRVRMGLHTGEAELRDGDYFGTTVNRAARLMAIGHGGQVLISSATAEMVGDADLALVDLGEHRLRDLERSMQVFQAGEGTFPPLLSLDAHPGNLPRQVTSFVGRDREVAETVEALASAPIVTLTGVGGVGKTRLAAQAAAEALPRFRDGAWLVELGSVRDGPQVVESVIEAFSLAIPPSTRPQDALLDFLRDKHMVLVLDNCEHLIGAAAALVSTVVAACPRVTVLATSREGLSVAGERIIAVPPLAAPTLNDPFDTAATLPAVRLFVDRAAAVDAGFALTVANVEAVAAVCRRLDGLPLAIELAAARVPAMSPAELESRLDRRFRILTGGKRGALDRHQTLHAAIDWSYDLLPSAHQSLLARLSVFAGGCTLDAAEMVCSWGPVDANDMLDLIADLVTRSLVLAVHDGPVTRYRLLETIRQYGEERLESDEAETLRARHGAYYARLAESYSDHFWEPGQPEWSRRITADTDNLVAAFKWAVDHDNADVALRICTSLINQVGYAVVVPAEPALVLKGAAQHRLYPLALAKSAVDAGTAGDRQLVDERCAQLIDAERRLGGRDGRLIEAWIADARATLETTYGQFHAAASHFRQAGELRSSEGEFGLAGMNFATASYWLVGTPDEADAVTMAEQAVTLAKQTGAPHQMAAGLALANALAGSEPARSRELLQEALEDMDRHRYHEDSTQSTAAAIVAARLGEWRLTLELARRALPILHWRGELPFLGGVLQLAASALAETGPHPAAVLQGAARHLALASLASQSSPSPATTGGLSTAGLLTDIRRDTSRRLAANLAPDQLAEHRAEGEEMDLEQAVAYALAEIDRSLAEPSFGKS